jgi:hypothetical protein
MFRLRPFTLAIAVERHVVFGDGMERRQRPAPVAAWRPPDSPAPLLKLSRSSFIDSRRISALAAANTHERLRTR